VPPPERLELPLRLVIAEPLPGVALAMQSGAAAKAVLVPPVSASEDAVVFDFTVTAAPSGPGQPPRLLGPMVQGPPDGRFAYVVIGAAAGQAGSPWSGRTKVPLGGIDWPLIDALTPGVRLMARIAGRGRGGGPAYATVPLLAPGWSPVST
jgi:hypothetical protein